MAPGRHDRRSADAVDLQGAGRRGKQRKTLITNTTNGRMTRMFLIYLKYSCHLFIRVKFFLCP
jgi:hypothetical protein